MLRHHLNWLKNALENHDKSRSKYRLLPIYYFFEFRYDDKSTKSSSGQGIFILFGTAFSLSAVLDKTCFCDLRTRFSVSGFAEQSTLLRLKMVILHQKRIFGLYIMPENGIITASTHFYCQTD